MICYTTGRSSDYYSSLLSVTFRVILESGTYHGTEQYGFRVQRCVRPALFGAVHNTR